MVKAEDRPIHGIICREDEVGSVINYIKDKKLRTRKSKQEYEFSEDEIEELCRP